MRCRKCVKFFLKFTSTSDCAEGRLDLERDEDCFIGGSRIFGVRCVFASLFGKRDSALRGKLTPALWCALSPEHWECSAEDSGLYSVFSKENKFNDHRQ